MKKIILAYWRGSKLNKDFYDNNTEFVYSDGLRSYLLEKIYDRGYDLMTQRTKNDLIIWISNDKFNIK